MTMFHLKQKYNFNYFNFFCQKNFNIDNAGLKNNNKKSK